MNVGLMHSGAKSSLTNLSSRRAVLRGGGQSILRSLQILSRRTLVSSDSIFSGNLTLSFSVSASIIDKRLNGGVKSISISLTSAFFSSSFFSSCFSSLLSSSFFFPVFLLHSFLASSFS